MNKTPTTFDSDHFHDLAGRFFDGSIHEDDAIELMETLQRAPELRRWFFRQFGTDYTLRLLEKAGSKTLLAPPWIRNRPERFFGKNDNETMSAEQGQTDENLLSVEAALEIKGINIDELVRSATAVPWSDLPSEQEKNETKAAFRGMETQPKTPKKNHSPLPWLLACILCLMGVAVYYEFHPNSSDRKPNALREFESFARVTAVAEPVFPEEASVFKVGRSVGDEEIRLASGLLELELTNGVRIVLEGPVSFRLQDLMKTFCRSGNVSVEVPKNAKGFTVKTPHADIHDLGTQFFVKVSDQDVQAHVLRGEIEVKKLSESRVSILENDARIFKPGGIDVQMPADKTLYVDQLRMNRESRAYEEKRHSIHRTSRRGLPNDPSLLLYAGTDAETSRFEKLAGSGTFRNVGCRLSQGQWGNQSAFRFSRLEDRLEINVPGRRPSLTLCVSLRVEKIDRPCNAVLMCRNPDPGTLFLQLDQDGAIQLRIYETEHSQPVLYSTPPVFNHQTFGVWHQLAVVIDSSARTISFYLDGTKIEETPFRHSVDLDLGQADVGNWVHQQGKTLTERHLDGSIDELILFDRPLSEDAIRALFY